MSSTFSPINLGRWVISYAALGLLPHLLILLLPGEERERVVLNNEDHPLTLGEVALWLPDTMLWAAGITLVVGLWFGIVHTALERSVRLDGNSVERFVHDLFVQVRFFTGILGIITIVGGITLVWIVVLQEAIADRIWQVIVVTATGIGLASGSAYYTR